jgi:hypothetical protein
MDPCVSVDTTGASPALLFEDVVSRTGSERDIFDDDDDDSVVQFEDRLGSSF